MNDWQRSFLGKLESAKKHWTDRFEDALDEHVQSVYDEFSDFTAANGFQASAPDCGAGTAIYKFGLTENGYLLLSFHLRGLDMVEATAEYFVPSAETHEPTRARIHLDDLTSDWVRHQFECSLDRFVAAFADASVPCEVA